MKTADCYSLVIYTQAKDNNTTAANNITDAIA